MLLQIMPYIFGAAISPILLATAVLLLAQPQKPRQKTLAYTFGGLTAASVVGGFIFFVMHARSQAVTPTVSDSVIHIGIGIILLILAMKLWYKENKKPKKMTGKVHYSRDFMLGVFLMCSNFTSLIMYVPAGVELQGASMAVRVTGLALLVIASAMAMWLPLILVIALGKRGQKILDKLSGFMRKHGNQVSGAMIGMIALYVLYKGVSGL